MQTHSKHTWINSRGRAIADLLKSNSSTILVSVPVCCAAWCMSTIHVQCNPVEKNNHLWNDILANFPLRFEQCRRLCNSLCGALGGAGVVVIVDLHVAAFNHWTGWCHRNVIVIARIGLQKQLIADPKKKFVLFSTKCPIVLESMFVCCSAIWKTECVSGNPFDRPTICSSWRKTFSKSSIATVSRCDNGQKETVQYVYRPTVIKSFIASISAWSDGKLFSLCFFFFYKNSTKTSDGVEHTFHSKIVDLRSVDDPLNHIDDRKTNAPKKNYEFLTKKTAAYIGKGRRGFTQQTIKG